MATGLISSAFDIVLLGGGFNIAKTFTAPRAFTIIGATAYNSSANAGTLSILNAGAEICMNNANPSVSGPAVTQTNAVVGPTNDIAIDPANSAVAISATVTVTAAGANAATIQRVILHCVGNTSTAIVVA